MKRIQPADLDVRNRIRKDRDHNLIIDAGAGTGKTQLIVDRVLELVAPETPGTAPIPLNRIAIITFTRRAAGELRFRIRAGLLEKLNDDTMPELRHSQLACAIEQIDTAFLGTIHSFADRLLRMRPIEAHLSPNYTIIEEIGGLAEETHRLLLHAAEAGTLATEAPLNRELADEAQQTIRDFCEAGLRAVTRESSGDNNRSLPGLDRFVRKVLENRDVLPDVGQVPAPDLEPIKVGIQEYVTRVEALNGNGFGQNWLRWRSNDLARVLDSTKPLQALAVIQSCLGRKPTEPLRKGAEFANDDAAWKIWNEYWGGSSSELDAGIGQLVRPLHDWMGARLAQTIPVIVELYDRIKSRHEAVDFLDILLRLRDVLRKSEPHAYFYGLFDHILVDEFQDTDPLQAEILFYLSSPEEPLENWRKMKPTAGRLTIVGDPKQSIYRFRRADILAYDEVCRLIPDAHREQLVTNFRSTPALIEFFNDQLGELLGRHDHEVFDRDTGQAYFQDLRSSFEDGPATAVHATQYISPPRADRPMEAVCLARHLRWLKKESGLKVRDPLSGELRDVKYGDVAFLARSTWHIGSLFRALEQYGIPYVARGGTLFLEERVVQSFILGLRAIADPDDGVALAALYRPPFFALDPGDVVARRHKEAEEFVQELRKLRFSRPPVATAMDLLNRTGFGRFLAVSPNGEQKLDAIHHLISRMDVIAQSEGLLFDAVTERLRNWIDAPVQMDAPAPIDRDAVQILTIHQAKGLEFPVTVLWDGSDTVVDSSKTDTWICSRDGREWAIGLHCFRASSPGSDLLNREAVWQDAERLRLYYVAATRARDLLIVPAPQPNGKPQKADKYMCARILDGAGLPLVETHKPNDIAGINPVEAFPEIAADERLDQQQEQHMQQWNHAAGIACKPQAVPVAFTEVAKAPKAPPAAEDEQAEKPCESSRFGSAFGSTVHRALARILAGDTASVGEVVHRAAIVEELTEHLTEATQDVDRALKALEAEGITAADVVRTPEYPLLLQTNDGKLLTGYADLVARSGKVTWLIDYKTDPPGTLEDYPGYAEQVRLYAQALAQAGVSPIEQIRAGLLFTADGSIRWMPMQ